MTWLSRFNIKHLLWIVVFLGVLAIPKIIQDDYYLDIFIMILLWVALAEAYNISGGYAGQFSLGHSVFMGLGAYGSTILFWKLGISPWIGMFFGAALAAAVALLIGGVCFRLRGPFLGLATIAATEVFHIIAVNWRSLTRGSEGIGIPFNPGLSNFIFDNKASYFYVAAILCGATILITWIISRSRLGYYLIAVRENQEAARALGVNTTLMKMVALLISAVLTALGGTFYAQYILYIDPSSLISFDVSIQFPLIAVVGGLGTIFGPLLGAAVMIPLTQVLRATLSGAMAGLDLALYGLILILVVFFLPNGLIGEIQKRYQLFKASLRGRHAKDQ